MNFFKNNFKIIYFILLAIIIIIGVLSQFLLIFVSDSIGNLFSNVTIGLLCIWMVFSLFLIIYIIRKEKKVCKVFVDSIENNEIDKAIEYIEKNGASSKIYTLKQESIYYLTFLGLMDDNMDYVKINLGKFDTNIKHNSVVMNFFIAQLFLCLLVAIDNDDKELLDFIKNQYYKTIKVKIRIKNKEEKEKCLLFLEMLKSYYNNDFDHFISSAYKLKVSKFKIFERVKNKINILK